MKLLHLGLLSIILLSMAGCGKSTPALPDNYTGSDFSTTKEGWNVVYNTTLFFLTGHAQLAPDVKGGAMVFITYKNHCKAMEAFNKWYQDNEIDDLVEHSTIKCCGYTLENPSQKAAFLNAIKNAGVFDDYYFYILTEKYQVLEIKGLHDYAAISNAACEGESIDVSTLKDTVNGLALADLFLVGQGGALASQYISSALHVPGPFFLTLDNAVWLAGLGYKLYRKVTADSRAMEMLEKAPTLKDKCGLVLTDVGKKMANESFQGRKAAANYCREWQPQKQEDIMLKTKAFLLLNIIDGFKYKENGVSACNITDEEINEIRKNGLANARTLIELKEIES